MIRKATINDLNKVLELYKEAQEFINSYNSPQWQDNYPNKETFFEDLKNGQIYINEKNNEIVGVASFVEYEPTYDVIEGNWLNNDPYVAIHRISTATKHLGKGYAKDFLNFLEDDLGYLNIKIDTHEKNEPMKVFLLKNGFVFCGIITLGRTYDNERLAYQKVVNNRRNYGSL